MAENSPVDYVEEAKAMAAQAYAIACRYRGDDAEQCSLMIQIMQTMTELATKGVKDCEDG